MQRLFLYNLGYLDLSDLIRQTPNFLQLNKKYQGVKEFHMLARIGCYCKIMVFSHFTLEKSHIVTSPRVTNGDAPSNL